MYLGGPPSTLDGLVQGLTNADHRYFGTMTNMQVPPTMFQLVCNVQAKNVMQPHSIHQIEIQDSRQVNNTSTDQESNNSIDKIADKLLSKMDALFDKKLEQRLPQNSNYNYRRNNNMRSTEGYRNEVSQPPPQPRYREPERTERKPNDLPNTRPSNRGCFNCGNLDHRQYECRNPCSNCGGDHVARVCQQPSRQPFSKSQGSSSNSIVATREDD